MGIRMPFSTKNARARAVRCADHRSVLSLFAVLLAPLGAYAARSNDLAARRPRDVGRLVQLPSDRQRSRTATRSRFTIVNKPAWAGFKHHDGSCRHADQRNVGTRTSSSR
jgi:hypothetical protein